MSAVSKPTPLEAGSLGKGLHLKQVYLHPGQMYVSKEPVQISMILGSCAGVCLYDRWRSIAGATHYMLPKWDGSGQPSPRYGDLAIAALLAQLEALGSQPGHLEAMVFGGACMFPAFRPQDGSQDHIGSRNVAVAINALTRLGIAIVTRDTGGENGRKITMQCHTGVTTVSPIRNS
jgi:chemotaxis protein CheD